MKTPQPFLSMHNATIRVANTFLFEHTSWQMNKNEHWLILGPNGSGKSTFAKALAGLLPLKNGEIIAHFATDKEYQYPQLHKDKIIYLSFETQQKSLTKNSLKGDLESSIGVEKQGMIVKDFLNPTKRNEKISLLDKGIQKQIRHDKKTKSIFSIEPLFHREISTLSTGEMRKVFLIKALLQNPKLLILDEPFDGLDQQTKSILMTIIHTIMKNTQIILITHRSDEISENITHILLVKEGKIFAQGKKGEIMKTYPEFSQFVRRREISTVLVKSHEIVTSQTKNDNNKKQIVMQMKNVTVRYGDTVILDHINWTIRDRENWVIFGSNGAGKSTLMHLISGDHQQRYVNSITIFGKKKDSGISVWEIKKKIGIISTDLMLRYQKVMKAYDVILSGFFDSIGLYKKATDEQKKEADTWIKRLDIERIAQKNYQELSFGQKRLILITRAVVKSPKLLILDEPCHGLDIQNRKRVLKMIDRIGETKINLLVITHQQDEIVPAITHIMKLENGKIIEKGKFDRDKRISYSADTNIVL